MTILITAGTGTTGRRIAARLATAGTPHRVGSRSGAHRFDWHDDATWDAALDGVTAAYLAFVPDLALPGAARTVGALARRAADAGAQRLVLLAGRGEESALAAEDAVRAAHPGATVVRSAFFMQNFSESLFREPLLHGRLQLPVDDVAEPFVDVEDLADVAVAALTDGRHAGRTYDVTGPRLLTFAEAVGQIAAASGRPMRYEPVDAEAYTAGLVAVGVPEEEALSLSGLFTEVLDGRNAYVGDGVHRALGRHARDFRDYAAGAAADGAWR